MDENNAMPKEELVLDGALEDLVEEQAQPDFDVAALVAERDSWRDKAYRAAAEADNAKKRGAADVAEARQYAVTKFALDVIGVGDNLARALTAPAGNEKALRDGVAMTAAQLQTMLARHNIAMIVVKKGDSLNPELHQAMTEIETSEVAPGAIVSEVQAGFTLNGRLLRPSMVVVARAPEATASEGQA